MNNINDHFFDGNYKDVWKAIIPAELTAREVDYIVRQFDLTPGKKVLDLMCGYGRHAIALAERGIDVVAIDNLQDYTSEVENLARLKSLPIRTIKANIVEWEPDDQFDLVICMGNSMNFFDENDTRKIFLRIQDHLKPGGFLLINSWSIAEITFNGFREKSWSKIGDIKILTDSRIVFLPTRIEAESTMISESGAVETKKGVDYIYSISDYERILKESGLILENYYSIPGKKQFTVGDPRIYLVARKP